MHSETLRAYVDKIPFFDSHSHMAGFEKGTPVDDRAGRTLVGVLTNDYLAYLAGSCWDGGIPAAKTLGVDPEATEDSFKAIVPLLDRCRALSTWTAFREGIRDLYGFDGDDITPANWREIDRKITAAYRKHGERAWQREVIRRAGVVKQVHICQLPYVTDHWGSLPPEERKAQAEILLPSLIIDGLCFTGFAVNRDFRRRSLEIVGREPTTYDQHRQACAAILDRFIQEGGNSIKLLAAYVRPLRFDEVPDSRAAALYAKGPDNLNKDELRDLQNNLLWSVLEMALARKLPLLVHTGYAQPVDWGNPEHLMNLLTSNRLKGIRIGLCHAGWPNETGAMIMARSYRNCYMDFSWIPLLSPALAGHILSVAVDIMPMNKLLMGTDCGTVECFFGAAKMVRAVLTEVLEDKIARGQFTMDTAKVFARSVLHDNAADFFRVPTP